MPPAPPLCLPASPPAVDPKLTLTLDKATIRGVTALEGADTAVVEFPTLTTSDIGGGAPEITCEGKFEGKQPLTYKPGVTAVFPVDTVEVTCTARDAAGNFSPAVKFPVTVCRAGVFFVEGSCNGGWPELN
jgi:hypothetical protein